MKRLKADLSHRMRRRELSIFDAWWFRLVLGTGVAIVLGLAVGPPVAGWFRHELGPREPGLIEADPAGPATRAGEDARGEVDGARAGSTAGVDPPAAPAVVAAPAPPRSSTEGPATGEAPMYRIQLGAFLDHRNADRLLERLREENLGAATSVVEQPRLVYRVVVEGPEPAAALVERLRGLGFEGVEVTGDGVMVSSAVPMKEAVEMSHRLRDGDLRVRLKQETGGATFRVVRVGSYGSSEEADTALAQLTARGFAGFVVRER
jgi:cell division septation protein DedD